MRTTPFKVRTLLNSSLTDPIVSSYIEVANDLVTEKLGSSTLGDTRLEMVERYLSAHLIAATIERMAKEEEIAEASIKYIGNFGTGLKSTPYGLIVLDLDTTGTFGTLAKRAMKITAIKSFDD